MPVIEYGHPIMAERAGAPLRSKIDADRNSFATHDLRNGDTGFSACAAGQIRQRRSTENGAGIGMGRIGAFDSVQSRIDIRCGDPRIAAPHLNRITFYIFLIIKLYIQYSL